MSLDKNSCSVIGSSLPPSRYITILMIYLAYIYTCIQYCHKHPSPQVSSQQTADKQLSIQIYAKRIQTPILTPGKTVSQKIRECKEINPQNLGHDIHGQKKRLVDGSLQTPFNQFYSYISWKKENMRTNCACKWEQFLKDRCSRSLVTS